MYDIICDIWKNPGAMYSPMPFWFWNDKLDRDELIRQVDEFHKKGIDGFVIHPRMGMAGAGYLSDEYFELVEAVLEAAKKRFMLVVLYDEAMYPSGSAHGGVVKADPRLAARRLYAVPAGSEIPEDEEVQFKVYVKLENGKLADTRFDEAEGYEEYDLVLGYTGGTIRGIAPDEDDDGPAAPAAADILNPASTEEFMRLTHEKYYEKLSPYFGNTVIGFFTDEPSVTGRGGRLDGGISWTYGMLEEFMNAGGDLTNLTALLFETDNNKLRRESEYIYRQALRARLGSAYYAPLSDWCKKHGVALMGHPAGSGDCGFMKYFDVPGQDLSKRSVEPGTELTSPDSVMAKCASDCARHMGISRSLNECFGMCGEKDNPWNFTPDEMMWYLNFLFARGCSMVFPHAFYYSVRTPLQSGERPPDVGPHSAWWPDYKKIAGYIKRMSWLNSTGSNNPKAAVLCSPEYMPVHPVKPLYENGYTFNYLTIDDFMNRAHIHDGTIRIDRYSYDILLIDGRLRLDTETVKKTGQFITEGGKMFRGSDFIGFMKKNVRLTSYFDGETHGNLRFTHYTKSGCPFFSFINEGTEEIRGHLVTDIGCQASFFDPFTGKTAQAACEMTDRGFEYSVKVGAHSAVIIGMDPDALPMIGEEEEKTVCEIKALDEGRMSFDYKPAGGRQAFLTFTDIRDVADIKVNGEPAGRLLFRPYELDITPFLREGENTVSVEVTPSAANTFGKPVFSGFRGAAVKVFGRL